MEKSNPRLAQLPVVFTSRSPVGAVIELSKDGKSGPGGPSGPNLLKGQHSEQSQQEKKEGSEEEGVRLGAVNFVSNDRS
jgi:hypothetical protein